MDFACRQEQIHGGASTIASQAKHSSSALCTRKEKESSLNIWHN